jgi:hypothetical protein
MTIRLLKFFGAAAILLWSGCRDRKVNAYRIPKEKDQPMPVMSAAANPPAGPGGAQAPGMADTPVVTASGSGLAWTAPAGWKAKAASAMRKGSYGIAGAGGEADLSITAFPGDVGGEVANLNRWRGQISLAPLVEGEVAAAVTRIKQGGLDLTVVDFTGTGASPQRILGAMVPFGGATWFFKLMGPAPAVAEAKPAFLEFLKTVKPAPASP